MSANQIEFLPFDDPRIDQGLQLFNAREFFACHDVLEDYWADMPESGKPLFQGLIQAAVALHHFEEGNLGGALRLYTSCRRYLTPFAPEAAGISVGLLLDELAVCFAELCQPHEDYPRHIRLRHELIPTILRQSG